MSSNFRYQHFVAISGNLGGKVATVDDDLSSQEQEIDPITLLDKNCRGCEFQTDWNKCWDMRRAYLALKLKFVELFGYETYKTKKYQRSKKGGKSRWGNWGGLGGTSFSCYSSKQHFTLNFFDCWVDINKRQLYNSIELYAFKPYISNNFKGATSEYKKVLHCKGYDSQELPDEIMEALLLEPFVTRRMKMLSRPDGFVLCGKLWVPFFLHFWIALSNFEKHATTNQTQT